MGPLLATVPAETLDRLHHQLSIGLIAIGVPVFVTLITGIVAPYGRYSKGGWWGPGMNARIAWMTQELPCLLVMLVLIHENGGFRSFVAQLMSQRTLLAGAFIVHYTYRALIFPFLLRGGKPTPVTVWLMSFATCMCLGFLQGWLVTRHIPATAPVTPGVMIGLGIWLTGWLNNIIADHILINLRKPGETGYKIPKGGMFNLVSAGNYTSEIMEWTGYAIAAGGALPAVAFAFFTFCNLAPRGYSHHKWYQQKFEDYPKNRKAVVPFIW